MNFIEKYPELKDIGLYLKSIGADKCGSMSCIFPNHQDSNASAGVYPFRGTDRYHCFTCDVDEDCIGLDMLINNRSFKESIKHLSDLYCFSLDQKTILSFAEQDKVESVLESKIFTLDKELSSNALAYLSSRGISKALEHTQIYSSTYHGVECLAFPMGDHSYTLRRLGDGEPKNFVIGSNNLSISICDERSPVFVVEGLFDYLSLKEIDPQYNIICLNGVGQYRKCAEYLAESDCETVVLFLDPDQAGLRTAEKLIKLLPNKDLLNVPKISQDHDLDINEILIMKNGENVLKDLCLKFIESVESFNSVGSKAENDDLFLELTTPENMVRTGFDFIDEAGGLDGLVFLGGMPGLGKTTFALQMVLNLLRQGQRVVYFSLEMTANALKKKMISADIYAHHKISVPTTQMKDILKQGVVSIGGDSIEISQIIRESVKRLNPFWRRLLIKCGPHSVDDLTKISFKKNRFVFIDYLQEIEKDSKNDKSATDRIVKELKSLRDKTNYPIVVLSGSARATYFKPMDISMFKDSGSIEYAANLLIGLNNFCDEHECNPLSEQYIEAKVLKNRSGNASKSEIFNFKGSENTFVSDKIISGSEKYGNFLACNVIKRKKKY